jgi:hypothetical protein
MRRIIITLAVLLILQTMFSGCLVVPWDHGRHEEHEEHEEREQGR